MYETWAQCVLPVQGRAPWPGGPADGRTAGGCTEDRTEGRGTPPEELQQLMQQLEAFVVLKYHDQSVEPLLILVKGGKR